MTLLPVVERELRVMARRKSTYRMRFFSCSIALLLLLIFIGTGRGYYVGKGLFVTMSGLVFVFSLLSGILLTADTLSGEKREGTLGLLFLTDLRGYDVVLGKLTATSVQAFYALLGLFPILGISLLMGGVTGSELFRVSLALIAAICFSLGCGLAVSSCSRDIREVMLKTFLAILFFSAAGPLVASMIDQGQHAAIKHLFAWLSPAACFVLAFDEQYSYSLYAREFWCSLVCIASLSIVLIGVASYRMPILWQDQSKSIASSSRLSRALRALPAIRGFLFKRPKLRDTDPFVWLGTRDTSSRALAWIAVLMTIPLASGFAAVVVFGANFKTRTLVWTGMVCAFLGHQLIKYLVALEGCRTLCEGRLSGALELHLTSPIGELQILKSLRKAVINQFWIPIACMAAANLVTFQFLMITTRAQVPETELLAMVLVGGTFLLLLDCWALAFLGQWRGLLAKDPSRAVAGALAWISGLPWVFAVIVFGNAPGGSSDLTSMGIWLISCTSISLISVASARNLLLKGIRSVLDKSDPANDSRLAENPAAPASSPGEFPGTKETVCTEETKPS